MPVPDWFAEQDAKAAGQDWFAAQDAKASGASSSASNFRPVEDVLSAAKGVGNFLYGMGKIVTDPAGAVREGVNQFVTNVGARQALGQSTSRAVATEGAKAVAPIDTLNTLAQGIGYAAGLPFNPTVEHLPSRFAEATGEAGAMIAAAKAGGAEPDTGTTFGVTRPKVPNILPKDTVPPAKLVAQGLSLPVKSRLHNPTVMDRALGHTKQEGLDTRGAPATTYADLEQDAMAAKRRIWSQYQQLQDPQVAMGSVIDGNKIADAMIRSIPSRTRIQTPAVARRIEQTANTYRRPVPVEQAEEFLQQANTELEGYYGENPALRSAAKEHPKTAAVVAEADALRDNLYRKLDEPGGGAAARELKRDYGAVSELQTAAMRRKIQLAKKEPDTAVTAFNRAQQILGPTGVIATGTALLGHPEAALLEGVVGLGMHAGREWLKNYTSPEGLLKRAMSRATLPTPVEMPPPPQIRGFLPPAVTRLPPVPEGPEPPMAVRGQYGRQLKQLPAPARQMPPVPEVEPPMLRQGEYGARWTPPPALEPPPPAPVAVAPELPRAPVAPEPAPQAVAPEAAPAKPRTPRVKKQADAPKAYRDTYYYPTYEAAKQALDSMDWPNGRVVPYQRGYAVQKIAGGTYLGPSTKAAEATPPPASVAAAEPAPAAKPPITEDPHYVRGTASRKAAPAITKPVEPAAPIAAPEQAAKVVGKQLERLVDLGNARSASEVHIRVMQAIEKEINAAARDAGFGKVEIVKTGGGRFDVLLDGEKKASSNANGYVDHIYDDRVSIISPQAQGRNRYGGGKATVDGPEELTSLYNKFTASGGRWNSLTPTEKQHAVATTVSGHFSRLNGAGQLVVRVPGDGTFTLERNPYVLREMLARLKKAGPSMWKDLATKGKK